MNRIIAILLMSLVTTLNAQDTSYIGSAIGNIHSFDINKTETVLAQGSISGIVRIFDVVSRKELKRDTFGKEIFDVKFVGNYLLVALKTPECEFALNLLSVPDLTSKNFECFKYGSKHISVAGDLAAFGVAREVYVLNTKTWTVEQKVPVTGYSAEPFLSPTGSLLAVTQLVRPNGSTAEIWRLSDKSIVSRLTNTSTDLAAFSQDERQIALANTLSSSSTTLGAEVWNISETPTLAFSVPTSKTPDHREGLGMINGEWYVYGGTYANRQSLEIVKINDSGDIIASIDRGYHRNWWPTDRAFLTPSQGHLLLLDADGAVMFAKLANVTESFSLPNPMSAVNYGGFLDNRNAVLGTYDGALYWVDTETSAENRRTQMHKSRMYHLKIDAAADIGVSSGSEKNGGSERFELAAWQASTGKVLWKVQSYWGSSAAVILAKQNVVVSIERTCEVNTRSLSDGSLVSSVKIPNDGWYDSCNLSPDGTRVVKFKFGGSSTVGEIWDAVSPKLLTTIMLPNETSRAIIFDDNTRVVFGLRDGKVRIHDTANGELLSEIVDPAALDQRMVGFTLSENEDVLVTAANSWPNNSANATFSVFDLGAGKLLMSTKAKDSYSQHVALNAHLSKAMFSGTEGSAIIWNLPAK